MKGLRAFFAALALASLALGSAIFRSQAGGEDEKTVLALGDSLTAGYGLPPGVSFPARLERWLRDQGITVTVINAGVSGDTSSGGRERLGWTLDAFPAGQPDLVILEFGANDMLRGLEPSLTRDNLDAMLHALKTRGIPTLVLGMRAAPNLGADYGADFDDIYPELAHAYGAALVPFFLEGVAGVRALNQADGIHPNAAGLDIIVENVGPIVRDLLEP
jgi:acyl-CoA thioesterase I